MFDFLRVNVQSGGLVLFPGTIAPKPDEFVAPLQQRGVQLELHQEHGKFLWQGVLKHREWGEAHIACPGKVPVAPRDMISLDPRLTEGDADVIAAAQIGLYVVLRGKRSNVLRDRKCLLRFMHALMGDDGIAALDHLSESFWTPQALAEELCHDADLDVESLFVVHLVTEQAGEDDEPRVTWMHTHGLGAIGRFDFDILHPHETIVNACGDMNRSLAFSILEGRLKPDTSRHPLMIAPQRAIRMVPARRFQAAAPARFTALRDDPENFHTDNRAVVCDPGGGLLSRFFGKPRPCGWLRRELPEPSMLAFSNEASELMADRARRTYNVLRRLREEFAELELPVIVKLGYTVDGGDANDREHMWFEVHHLGKDTIDATLINQPFGISRIKEGDRAQHPVEKLSEWSMLTPFGSINPRWSAAARFMREQPDLVREMVAAAKAEGSD